MRRAHHAHRPVGSSRSPSADLQAHCRQAPRLVGDGAGGDVRGAAGHHRVATGVGADAERDHRGVAVPDDDVAGLEAELVGHYLCQRRGRSLAVR